MRKRLPAARSHCPIAYALDFIGDRWTLIVLRDLILGRKRYFQEFLDSDGKIASNILAARLKLFEASGLVTREADPALRRRIIYKPTSKALDLLPVMLELVRWGEKHYAKSGAPRPLLKRIAADRDGFIAELRAAHAK